MVQLWMLMVRRQPVLLRQAAYNDTNNTIVLTGTGFDLIDGGANGDIMTQMNWTKFTWDIDGDSTATGGTFVVGDIDPTVVNEATQLTITLEPRVG